MENTLTCMHCGEIILNTSNFGGDEFPLCNRCSSLYVTCEDCGRLILESTARYPNDSDYPYCADCFSSHEDNRIIHDYYYKPKPVFFGEGPRYFGVELEIDGAGEDECYAERILNIANNGAPARMYAKHDGSLEDGFELVTFPLSIDYHLKEMPWDKILYKARDLGYTSHSYGTCGLHVHVSRKAFGDTVEDQDACIARILYFFEAHWNELLRFSRRTEGQLNQWAARYGFKTQPKEILDHAKKGYGNGRYTSINLMNAETIEFRIFRGTLKLNTFLATLQLVDYICDVALFMSDDEIKKLSWSSFVTGITQPELIQYLKERSLYINEPVRITEEEM